MGAQTPIRLNACRRADAGSLGEGMTLRVGYLGGTLTPEFRTLRERKNAVLVALYGPDRGEAAQVAAETGAAPYDSADALVREAELDALFLNLPPAEEARLACAAAERRLPTFVVPPVAPSFAEAEEVLSTIRRTGVITSVGWPMRYAINLIQLRQTVRARGARWLLGRVVAGVVSEEELLNKAAGVCDLVRYVGGPFDGDRAIDAPGEGILHVRLGLVSGATAQVSLVAGWSAGEEVSIEALAGGDRMAWYFGTNHIVINGREQRVAEKVEGLYVAEVAAFLTAVETGRRSPVLCDYAEAVETLRVTDALRQAWEHGT